MTWQKTYITWTRFMADPRYLVDPTSAVNTLWKYNTQAEEQLRIQELSYGNVVGDLRLLAIVEWDDTIIDETIFQKFINNFSYHSFVVVSPTDALKLCNGWYPSEEEPYFSLGEDGFTLIDNRPTGDETI